MIRIKSFTSLDLEDLDEQMNKFLEEHTLDIETCRIEYKHKVKTHAVGQSIIYIAHIEYDE
jgi:hypothetical protein